MQTASESRWGEAREVVSDDADIDRVGGYRLSIFLGGNGDWYVSILAPEERLGPCVRLRTSGGASSDHPGLCVAIADAYRALGHEEQRTDPLDLANELALWRNLSRQQDRLLAAYRTGKKDVGPILDKMDKYRRALEPFVQRAILRDASTRKGESDG